MNCEDVRRDGFGEHLRGIRPGGMAAYTAAGEE
ncbi:hypothetical protein MPP7335_03219 [Mycolicibacterium parafortuitum]|uniref:Uncharacterized protein n=1 Tax=Mycolicibacterium parafortuitum TaxID=39692 RepID=A0A375YJZ5_MYCPF|nr:hypothetical protein MPP7335_03219 [Mycolicibacterium parafortuitum]